MGEHGFHVLPYDGSENVLVVVCDCGWADITNSEKFGRGWDAACLYARHLGIESPEKHGFPEECSDGAASDG